MQAEFYLFNNSFRSPESSSKEIIEDAIVNLSTDYDFIKKNNDKVFKHSSIYNINLVDEYKIEDLYYPDKKCPINKSVKKYLLKVIDKSKSTSWSNDEITDLINEQETNNLCEEKICYGFLALFRTDVSIKEEYIIYNERNWFEFHRYFLEKYPCDSEYFIDKCKNVFPNLFFHDRNYEKIKDTSGGWENSVKSFICGLVCLNDKFPKYIKDRDSYQRIEVLRLFGAECNLNISNQGNAGDKPKMTFSFMDKNNNEQNICCEPHIKFRNNDNPGDTTRYNNRIYFHEGKLEVEEGKTLIGHIGNHIEFS